MGLALFTLSQPQPVPPLICSFQQAAPFPSQLLKLKIENSLFPSPFILSPHPFLFTSGCTPPPPAPLQSKPLTSLVRITKIAQISVFALLPLKQFPPHHDENLSKKPVLRCPCLRCLRTVPAYPRTRPVVPCCMLGPLPTDLQCTPPWLPALQSLAGGGSQIKNPAATPSPARPHSSAPHSPQGHPGSSGRPLWE